MESKISKSIKNVSFTVLVTSIAVGVVYFLISLSRFMEYQNYSSLKSEYAIFTESAKTGMIYSLIILFVGITSSVLISGFADLVDNSFVICNYLKNNQANISSEKSWECRCGHKNNANESVCKNCGEDKDDTFSTWSCDRCGKENKSNTDFCLKCGKPR